MSPGMVSFVEVKRAVSLEKVLARYGLLDALVSRGANLSGSCPFCNGSGDRCFRVSLEKNVWYCFGCKAGGNVLDFVARREKVNIRAAACALNDWFGLGLSKPVTDQKPDRPRVEESNAKSTTGLPNQPLTFALKTLDFTHASLTALGLSDEVVRHFGLGFCSKGILKGRIAIPIRNPGGELLAYAGLSTEPEARDRYLFPPKFQPSLEIFNAASIANTESTDPAYLCSEILNVLRLADAGVAPVLGLFDGTLSETQEAILGEFLIEGSRLTLVGESFDLQTIVRLATFFAVRCLSVEALLASHSPAVID